MKSQNYKEISPYLLMEARAQAWSKENMAGHGKEHLKTEYEGSYVKGNTIYDYYRDSEGGWWYDVRKIADNRIVSMDVYLFGREIKKRGYK